MASDFPLVLITGSQGRIGRAIAAALAGQYTVVGLERSCQSEACLQADIASDEALAAACQALRERYGSRIASVIHLAAYYDFSGEPDPRYAAVNVEGTRRLLKALQRFEVEQFVYASTMLVHAPGSPGAPLDEQAEIAPRWAYPASKRDAEAVVREAHGDIPAVILRLAGVYTDDCEVPSLAYQIQRIFERQALSRVFPGDPSHGQSFVHLDDVAEAFRLAVDRRHALSEETTLLIGEPVTESYASLQNLIARRLHGRVWSTRRMPKPMAASGAWAMDAIEEVVPDVIDQGIEPFIKPFMVWLADDHYELDVSRADALLGWRPRHRLRQRLPAMIDQLRRRPAEWYRKNRIALPLWLADLAAQSEPAGRLLARHDALVCREHRQTLWCHFANAALGLWLACSPFVFGLSDRWGLPGELVAPNQRGLLYSDTWMALSDLLSGVLIAVFALAALSRQMAWARWAAAAVGGWLLFAPLVWWTPSAAVYANDTLLGALVIVLAVGLPAPPGISPVARLAGPDRPPGWDYSPSSWHQRIPIIALALVGLFVSRYLAAFQLGHIDAAWDPFFGEGSERIVTSSVSEAWPISDAGLGAATYALEIVTGLIGDRRRWRTMPWLVLLFGFMIVPLGAVSLFFIIIQPIVIGTWCTLCLVAAVAMLLQIPYSFDEILATIQFLKARRRKGKPLWSLLLHGDTLDVERAGGLDREDNFEAPPSFVLKDMLKGGVTLPWTLAASAVLGVLLMFSRVLFDAVGTAADNDHVAGALLITFSVMALAEVARPARFVNALLGAWLLGAPWLLDGYSGAGAFFSTIAGLVLVVLAVPLGPVESHYGAWDKALRAGGQRFRGAVPE